MVLHSMKEHEGQRSYCSGNSIRGAPAHRRHLDLIGFYHGVHVGDHKLIYWMHRQHNLTATSPSTDGRRHFQTDDDQQVAGRVGLSSTDWGSRGRRFKSCQPDRKTASELRKRRLRGGFGFEPEGPIPHLFRKYSRTEVDSVVLSPGQLLKHVGDVSRDGRLGDVELAGDGGGGVAELLGKRSRR